MSEQEVHEIQLNGKQLVFMFMAATVVSVVIFLCGVMVGRGVRQPATTLALNTETAVDPTAQSEPAPPDPALTADSTTAPVQEKLTYAERLESVSAPRDNAFRSPAPTEKPAVAPAVVEQEPPAKVVAAKETTPRQPKEAAKTPATQKVSAVKPDPVTANASLAEPPGRGWVVQVMALPTRGDADALAQRLNGKGYPTFVAPNTGAASLKYRVRVGKYNTKAEADAVANRLKQQERFKPWVTR